MVEDGQEVSPGDVLAKMPKETAKTKDITGSLPRVVELSRPSTSRKARKSRPSRVLRIAAGRSAFRPAVFSLSLPDRGSPRVDPWTSSLNKVS
jgi:DNA-directed RNA polymerase subunit beta'